MSEINELKEKLIVRRIKWMRAETTLDYMVSDMTDLLIGITEHLEAAERPCEDRPSSVLTNADRLIMVKALMWAARNTTIDRHMDLLISAVRRLENGCDL